MTRDEADITTDHMLLLASFVRESVIKICKRTGSQENIEWAESLPKVEVSITQATKDFYSQKGLI